MQGIIQSVDLSADNQGCLTVSYPDGSNVTYTVIPATEISGGLALKDVRAGWGAVVVTVSENSNEAQAITVYPN